MPERASLRATPAEVKKPKRGREKPKPGALLLTVAAAGRLLGVSPKVARAMIGKGLIPARTLGGRTVIVRAELEQLIARLPAVTSLEGALARLDTFDRAEGH